MITRGDIGRRIWIYQIIKSTTDSTDNNSYTDLFMCYRVGITGKLVYNFRKSRQCKSCLLLFLYSTPGLLLPAKPGVGVFCSESYFIRISTLVSQKVETTRGVPLEFSPFCNPLSLTPVASRTLMTKSWYCQELYKSF